MSDFVIDKSITSAVTGHRFLYSDFDENKLKEAFTNCVNKGVNNFLIGMALGFDTVCFKVLEKLRTENNNIKIIACVPCKNQDFKFSFEQKKEYSRMLDSANQVIILGEDYTPTCMMDRNRFMVDNSDYLIAYKRRNYGGTAGTVNYAKKKGATIIEI